MDILLTGASGFLGKTLYLKLQKEHNIMTLGRKNSTIISDITQKIPSLAQHFETVIHSAGKAHLFPKTELENLEFYKVNILGTKNLLEALSNTYLPRSFVYVSSVAVYGKEKGIGIDENTPLAGVDSYGLSKIKAEQLVLDWCKKNNVICTILRLPLLVGPNPPGNLAGMIEGIKKGYFFNISGGEAQKSMVLVTDIAEWILIVSEIGGIYNLTDGYHPNFNELSHSIVKQMGRKFVPNMPIFIARILAIVGDFVGDKFPINSDKLNKITSTLTFDDSKAREAFGWSPTPVLKGFKIHE